MMGRELELQYQKGLGSCTQSGPQLPGSASKAQFSHLKNGDWKMYPLTIYSAYVCVCTYIPIYSVYIIYNIIFIIKSIYSRLDMNKNVHIGDSHNGRKLEKHKCPINGKMNKIWNILHR